MSERTDQDRASLEAYSREGCEKAFAELVQRNIDLVWGAAFRVCGDSELARDVAQTVFTDLARKARFFPSAATVPGWLYRAALMAARKAIRNNARRSRREKEAMEEIIPEGAKAEGAVSLDELTPILDEGLQSLPQKDREVVVLRFFARKSLAEIGTLLAISEDAAQKRVSRAVDRLKSYFQHCGHSLPVGTVLALLTAAGSVAAPTGMAGTVAGISCAAVTAAGATGWIGSVASFVTGTTEQIVLMKTKLIVASLALAGVGTPLVMQNNALATLDGDYAALIAATRELEELRAQNQQLASQRQLAADWSQHQRDLDELRRLRDEAKRLTEAAEANPELQQRLAEARQKHAAAKAVATLASDTMQAEELRVQIVDEMKHLGLAARIFSTDNGGRYPKTFADMKNELAGKFPEGTGLDRFEFVEHEREVSVREPQLIVFREKEPRRLPNGKWTKAYTFADGSVQNVEQDTPDFTEWEKPYIGRAKDQASR